MVRLTEIKSPGRMAEMTSETERANAMFDATPRFYKPNSYVGVARAHAETQTAESEVAQVVQLHRILRGVESEVQKAQTELLSLKSTYGENYAENMHRTLTGLYARVNDKLRWVEDRHRDKVDVVRAACRVQLENEMAKIDSTTTAACRRLAAELRRRHAREIDAKDLEIARLQSVIQEKEEEIKTMEKRETVNELLLQQQQDQVEALEASLTETLATLDDAEGDTIEREKLEYEMKEKNKLLDNLVRKLQRYQKRERQIELQWQNKLNGTLHVLHRQHVAQLEDVRMEHVRKERHLIGMLQETQRRLYEAQKGHNGRRGRSMAHHGSWGNLASLHKEQLRTSTPSAGGSSAGSTRSDDISTYSTGSDKTMSARVVTLPASPRLAADDGIRVGGGVNAMPIPISPSSRPA